MEATKPRIAIVCGQNIVKDAFSANESEVGSRYTAAVIRAGGLPFLIPVDFPLPELGLLFELFDGLLLIGGDDVAIERFGGKPHAKVSAADALRDEIEIQLVRQAMTRDFPLMGICRGMQVMNVAMGGSLITDIGDQIPGALEHQRNHKAVPMDTTVHPVQLTAGSNLREIYGEASFPVNSFHHQSVKELSPCFRLAAVHAPDQVIEAFEAPDKRFVIGVQWHPEALQALPLQQKLFRAFLAAGAAK